MPLASILVIGTGAVAAYRLLSDRSYSPTKMDCRDIDVRPLARLLGAGPVVPVEEDPDNGTLSCEFRVSGDGGMQLGVGLITIVAATSRTPQQAREDFERAAESEEGKNVNGVGERATLLVTQLSSDAPQAMTDYVLDVLDGNLVLAVRLQAFTAALPADQTTVQRELVNVAQDAMSTLC